MIDLSLYKQLDTVARCGSLNKAAKELGVSQPALSKSMRRLETQLDTELFTRARTKLVLNEAGIFAARQARILLEQEQLLRDSVKLMSHA